MLGVVIVTHGQLGKGLKDSVAVVMGQDFDIKTISLGIDDDVAVFGRKVEETIVSANDDQGVIVFTDLVSASPYNQAVLAVNRLEEDLKKTTYVIGGVNLAMLLDCLNHQILGSSIEDAVTSIMAQGKNAISSWCYEASDTEALDDEF